MNVHENHRLLFALILFGFLFLALLIGVIPAFQAQGAAARGASPEALSGLERRGLEVYVAEGCVACHTQQVRPLEMDRPWGRPSAPQDYGNVPPLGRWSPYAPAVLGSARTGPDLADVGARQPSDAWHYLHLYQPRAVVADSVMPAYPWLFDEVLQPGEDDVVVNVPDAHAPDDATVVAGPEARALVAYLLALRQPELESKAEAAR